MQQPEAGSRKWWTNPAWLLVLLLPLLAGRVLADPGGMFLGHPLGEQYNGLWIQWLFNRALEQGRLPLSHPQVLAGVDLWIYPVDPSTLFVRWLLSLVIGQLAAYTVTALALVGLLAGATVLLAREVGLGRWGATLAGLVAALHPGFLGFLADGRSESCVTGWSVLVLWAALRLVRHPGPRGAAWLAVLMGALALAGPNHFVATVAVLLLPGAVFLLRGSWRLRRFAALAAAGGAVLCLPVLAGVWKAELQKKARSTWNPGARPALLELLPAAEARRRGAMWMLADRLTRTPGTHDWDRMTEQKARFNAGAPEVRATLPPTTLSAPGARRFIWISALLLAIIGLLRRPGQVWPWLAGAAALGLLSFGNGCGNTPPMALPWTDQYLMFRPGVLLRGLPLFLNYGIFASLGAVGLGVAAGFGLASLPWRPAPCGALALALCFCEAQLAGPTPLPLPATRVSRPARVLWAMGQTPRVTVATFPCDTRQLLLQTWHERKVLFQWNKMNIWLDSSVHDLQRLMIDGHVDWRLLEQLRKRGVDAVIVFPGLLTPGVGHRLIESFTRQARYTIADPGRAVFFLL